MLSTFKAASWMTENWDAFDVFFDSKHDGEEKNIAHSIQSFREALGVKSLKEKEKAQPITAAEILVDKSIKLMTAKRAFKVIKDKDGQPCVLIYDSKDGDPNLNLNVKAKDSKGEMVVCRHLSDEVATRRMKGYSQDFSTIEGIEKQPRIKEGDGIDLATIQKMIMEDNASWFDIIRLRPNLQFRAYYNLFHPQHMGTQLQTIASFLTLEEECSLKFQFVAAIGKETHIMALSVRYKNNGTYVIKFYDPNATNMHRRALCKDLASVSLLNIDYLWDIVTHIALEKVGKNSCFEIYSLEVANPFFIVNIGAEIDLEDMRRFTYSILKKSGSRGENGLQVLLPSLLVNPHLNRVQRKKIWMISVFDSIKNGLEVGKVLSDFSSETFKILYKRILNNPYKPIKTVSDYFYLQLSLSQERKESVFKALCPTLALLITTPGDFLGIQRFLTEQQNQELLEAMYRPIRLLVEEGIKRYIKVNSRSLANPIWTAQISTLREAKTPGALNAAINSIHQSFLGRCTLLKALEKTGALKELYKFGYEFPTFNGLKFFEPQWRNREVYNEPNNPGHQNLKI